MLQHLNHSTSSFNERQKQQHIKIWVNEISSSLCLTEGKAPSRLASWAVFAETLSLVDFFYFLLTTTTRCDWMLQGWLPVSLTPVWTSCFASQDARLTARQHLTLTRCLFFPLVLSHKTAHTFPILFCVCECVCLWFNYLKYSRETAVRQLHFYLFQTFALSENQPEALIRQTQPVCKCILISYNEQWTLSCRTAIMCWMCLLLSPVSPRQCSSGVADRRKKHACQLFCQISCWSHFIFCFSTFLNFVIINSMFSTVTNVA